jgi:hypothetical protein
MTPGEIVAAQERQRALMLEHAQIEERIATQEFANAREAWVSWSRAQGVDTLSNNQEWRLWKKLEETRGRLIKASDYAGWQLEKIRRMDQQRESA